MHKNLFSCLLAFALIFGVGCRHNVNTKNPKVVMTATLLDASNTCKTLEDGLLAANSIVEQLETSEPEYYAHVKPLLQKLSAANRVASQKVDAAAHGNTTDWRGALNAVAASVKPSDLTSFGFKNPTSQALVNGGFQTLVFVLNEIPGKFGATQ